MTHYPSRKEILQKLRLEFEWIRTHSDYAEFATPSTTPIDYRSVVGEKGSNSRFPSNLLEDHYRFLCHVTDAPQAKLTDHYDALGGRGKGKRLGDELVRLGYLRLRRQQSPRPGRAAEIAEVTPAGLAFMEAYETRQRNA